MPLLLEGRGLLKALVVFYSRTGITKKVALEIVNIIHCDSEEIIDTKDRVGTRGYLLAGKDAAMKKLTDIKKPAKNPSLYDMVIIGSPVWAFTLTPAIRTYIIKNKEYFRKVAFFCTQGGVGSKTAFGEMQVLCGQEPIALLELNASEISGRKFELKIKRFVSEIDMSK
jgi:flavodoxin